MQKFQPLYVKIDSKRYQMNGEVLIVSSPQTFDEIVGNVGIAPKGGFSITREQPLCDSFKNIHGKMGIVFSYLIEKRDSNNQIIYDPKAISFETKLSRHTIIDTIKHFEKEGMIAREGQKLMIHPGIIHKGNRQREAQLLKIFENMQNKQ